MGAKNMVIAGDYMGKPITGIGGVVQIYVDRKNYILLDKFGVDSYDVITEDTRKSAASGIARGAVGAALLGPVGLLAGLSAKTKAPSLLRSVSKTEKTACLKWMTRFTRTLSVPCFKH